MNENPAKLSASMLAAPAPLTVLMLVTILLVSAPSLNRSSAPPVSSGASKDVKIVDLPQSVPPSAALHALLDYHGDLPGVSPSRSANSSADAQSPIAYYLQELQQLKQHSSQTDGMKQLQCLIALVPDPLDSHFPLTFDNAISSLHQAFRDHGYVRDRQAFLWQYAAKGDATTARPGAINPALAVPQDHRQRSGGARRQPIGPGAAGWRDTDHRCASTSHDPRARFRLGESAEPQRRSGER